MLNNAVAIVAVALFLSHVLNAKSVPTATCDTSEAIAITSAQIEQIDSAASSEIEKLANATTATSDVSELLLQSQEQVQNANDEFQSRIAEVLTQAGDTKCVFLYQLLGDRAYYQVSLDVRKCAAKYEGENEKFRRRALGAIRKIQGKQIKATASVQKCASKAGSCEAIELCAEIEVSKFKTIATGLASFFEANQNQAYDNANACQVGAVGKYKTTVAQLTVLINLCAPTIPQQTPNGNSEPEGNQVTSEESDSSSSASSDKPQTPESSEENSGSAESPNDSNSEDTAEASNPSQSDDQQNSDDGEQQQGDNSNEAEPTTPAEQGTGDEQSSSPEPSEEQSSEPNEEQSSKPNEEQSSEPNEEQDPAPSNEQSSEANQGQDLTSEANEAENNEESAPPGEPEPDAEENTEVDVAIQENEDEVGRR